MRIGLRYLTLKDAARPVLLRVLYPLPLSDNPWGVLEPMRETEWSTQIPIVTGVALSHAMHGYTDPLHKLLGNPPRVRAARLPIAITECFFKQSRTCTMATEMCFPGSTKMPDCYAAPSTDLVLQELATVVAKAWDEGRYVFVVEGPEHLVK